MRTVKPLIVSRVADIVQNSSQGILISMLLGNIAIVGYYGNYVLVTGAVGIMYSQLGAAFTSSFGNLAIEGNCVQMYNAYRKADIIMSSLATIIFAGFVVCIQDFISLAFGKTFLLTEVSMIIIAISMFITLINIPMISVQNATGTHNLDVHNMLIQALLSIILGFVGGKWWGIEGLLLGSLLSLFIFTTIIKGAMIYKNIFNAHPKNLVKSTLTSMFLGIICCFLSTNFTSFINFDYLILNILCKGIVTVLVSVVVLCITMFKNTYFKEVLMILKKKISMQNKKKNYGIK